jgi:tetratricopeptide (TPR) repeat protein
VRTAAGAPIDFTLLDAPDNGWRLVGPLPSSRSVVVRLAGPEGRAVERVYATDEMKREGEGEAPRLNAAGALWASDRLALQVANDDSSREDIVAFARRHRVAGPDVSFIVLERPADYARAGIEPPLAYAASKRAEFDRLLAEKEVEERRYRETRLATVLKLWDEQKAWWRKRFDPDARPSKVRAEAGPPPPAPVTAPPPAEAPPGDSLDELPAVESSSDEAVEGADIVVTGTLIRRPNLLSNSPVTTIGGEEFERGRAPAKAAEAEIEIAEWTADRPYLKALAAARASELETVLARQQAEHGALPAFWLDVSDFYYRAGRKPEALRLLLSALDLPTRNSETVAVVAARLARWGELDRAVQLYERLAAAESDRPQPLRSLALALGKRAEAGTGQQAKADLERSIALLTEVVMTAWDEDYEGIELISLMDVNRLIARYRKLGGSDVPLHPRLIALLDLDLRVTIEWNTEETDLDLWVDEPNGERAMYSNPATAIGGRLSNDMTNGYGPEEYLLRRAPDGHFTVRADVYSADELNPNGPSRITAHLVHDFGRPQEREEVIDVELLPGDKQKDERLIGRIRVRR